MTTSGRAKEIVDRGDALWSARGSLTSLWQELADNFYPERADFTTKRSLGDEFASHLMTGAPVLARRDLANQINAMLRPRGKTWFNPAPEDEELSEQPKIIEAMEDFGNRMRRAMYQRETQFTRATKEGDHDFATFGQAVLTCEFDLAHNSLLYRCWHLRDVAWAENYRGEVDTIHRKWMQTARNLMGNPRYKDKVPAAISRCIDKEPHKEFELRHVIVPFDEYDYKPEKKVREGKYKFMCLTVTKDDSAVLCEEPMVEHPYIIPRWQTVSGSPYAHSPATVIALPDARLLQRITYTLLEAGEKATNPPMIAVGEAIRSDIALYAGGITMVESDYDEKLGEVLRPLSMDNSGLKFGWEMGQKHEEMIKQAFYLNLINLPPMGDAMTATEIRVRTEEYVRAAMPLFEPMEMDYNAALCEKTFNLLMNNGGFGNPREWPEEILGQNIKWVFESPLADAQRKEDAVSFKEAAELLAIAGQIDPALVHEFDARESFRNAMRAVKAPLISDEEADAMREQAQQAQQMQQVMGAVGGAAGVGEQVGKAAQAMQAGFAPPEQQGAAA